MWIKMAGGAMVVASCAVLGLYYSMKTGFRINDLTELKKALLLLKGEIEFAHSSLPEAMQNVAERLDSRLAAFFLTAREYMRSGADTAVVFNEAVKDKLSLLHLDADDLRSMERLGETLGFLSKHTQIEGVEMAVLYIDSTIERLKENEGRSGRLYRNAGILFGILLVIILI